MRSAFIEELMPIARDGLRRGWTAIWRSMAAVVRTTAVWIAVVTIAIVMFAVGHVDGSRGKRELREQIETLTAKHSHISEKLAATTADLNKVRAMAKEARDAAAAPTVPAPPAARARASTPRSKSAPPPPDQQWRPF